jgi:peroxidase
MMMIASTRAIIIGVFAITTTVCAAAAAATATPELLRQTDCPQLPGIVRAAVDAARRRDVQITAGLLRIFFHDCLPQVHSPCIYSVFYSSCQ